MGKACYKNVDLAQFYEWTKHGELMRGRSTHNTVYMDGQLYHIAGYAKDWTVNPPVVNGRRVEKWETPSDSSPKHESQDILYNYNSPQSSLFQTIGIICALKLQLIYPVLHFNI